MTSRIRGIRRAAVSALAAGAVVGATVMAAPLPAQAAKPGGTLKIMTQNLYLGADLFPAVEAAGQGTTPFLLAAATVYQGAMASDFPLRAAELAKTIKAEAPDLIGLQEVTNWVTFRKDPAGPALQSVDFLAVLAAALRAEGLSYKVVGTSDNASLGPFPYIDAAAQCSAPTSSLPTEWDCAVGMKDRDVILVNTRSDGLSYKKSSVRTGLYTKQQTFEAAGQTISFARGYVYAEFTYKGATFRFANTHLEVGEDSEAIQIAQGKQFVKIVKKGADTVIATGDFNSDAYGGYSPVTYQNLTKYFTDSWVKKRDGKGLSCCQNAELSNPVSQNDTRIDFVFLHGDATSKAAENTNITPFRPTPAPLWESDHAGVVAKVKVG